MTTKIYGCSDDLVEFRGDIDNEIGAYEAQDKGILLSDGTVLECSYPKTPELGVWGFKLVCAGLLFDRIEECNDEDAEVYSDVVFFQRRTNRLLGNPPRSKAKSFGTLKQIQH